MRDSLTVSERSELGKLHVRRLRNQGKVPAILYGHGEANVNLAVPSEQVALAVRHGSRLVDLNGAVNETVLVRQVQWDAFGLHVLHLDFSRISADESVDIVLPIELKGAAIGTKEGGVIEHIKHELRIRCPALRIPEKLEVNISALHLDQAVTSGQVTLPEGAQLLTDADEIVVHCIKPMVEDELSTAAAESGEPEVIGRKKEDAEGEGGDEE
ncbi:MAG: 50S ribosomal protein L25 [Planctomycetes bacterium]|nr:50S ribosomal protein L25 [Planctomycetota bacterium]